MLKLVVIQKIPEVENSYKYQVFEGNKEVAVFESTDGALDATTVEVIRTSNYALA